MFRAVRVPTLSLLLALAASPLAQATDPGQQAISYLTYQARLAAERSRSVDAFAQSRMDDYEFYRNFVNFGGATHLPVEVLGSWEFADRIENLRPYWAPVNWNGISQLKQKAAAARLRTGVVYDPARLAARPVSWIRDLADGKAIPLSPGARRVFAIALRALAPLEPGLRIEHRFGRFESHPGYDERVWAEYRLESVGQLPSASLLGRGRPVVWIGASELLLLSEFVTRAVHDGSVFQEPTARIPERGIEIGSISSIRITTEGRAEEFYRAMVDGLGAEGWTLEKVAAAEPRELGVKPNDSCWVFFEQPGAEETVTAP